MSTFSSDRSRDGESPSRRGSSRGSRSRSRSPARVRVRSKRVIIANIPYHVTWQKLKEIFRDKVGFTGFLQMFRSNGKPNGMGVMEFKTYEGAEKAIQKMHRFEIGDRKLVVREENARDAMRIAQMEIEGADPKETLPASTEQPPTSTLGPVLTPYMLSQMGIEAPITDSIYISNLEYNVTWQKLKDVFKSAGKIVSAVVKTDKEGKSRGVAIIKFSYPYEAVQAVSMFNNQILKDRPMRVKIDRRGTPAPPGPIYAPSHGAAKAESGILGSSNLQTAQSPSLVSALSALLSLKSTMENNSNAIGSGLPEVLRPTTTSNTSSNQASNLITQLLAAASNANSSNTANFNSPQNNLNLSALTTQDSLQQLVSAALAGGMSQAQLTSALSSIGVNQTNLLGQQQSGQNLGRLVDLRGGVGIGGGSGNQKSMYNVDRDRHHIYDDDDGGRAISDARNNDIYDIAGRSKYRQSEGNYRTPAASLGGARRDIIGEIANNIDEVWSAGFMNRRSNSPIKATAMLPISGRNALSRPVGSMERAQNGRRQILDKLVVKNLPFSTNTQDLRRLFREIGEVCYCNMPNDSQGRSQGVAFISFTNPENVERAITRFDGTVFEGRRIRLHAE